MAEGNGNAGTTAVVGVRQSQSFGGLTVEKSAELAAIAVAAAAKAEVEAAYIMALKKPRHEEDARAAIVKVCGHPNFAAKAKYKKPVGKVQDPRTNQWVQNYVHGPSIRFAEEALRHWGNVLIQQSVIYEDESRRIVKVSVKDLESNLSYSAEVSVEKTVERKSGKDRDVIAERVNSSGQKVYVVRATEDEIQVKQAAHVSKAIRNSGLRLIPEHILEDAMAKVGETLAAKIRLDPEAERKRAVDAFAGLGVKASDLEQYLGHPLAQATADELVDLQEVYTSIRDGHARWAEYVAEATPVSEADQEAEKAKLASVQAALKAKRETKATPPATSEPESEPESESEIDAAWLSSALDLEDAIRQEATGTAALRTYRTSLGLEGDAYPHAAQQTAYLARLRTILKELRDGTAGQVDGAAGETAEASMGVVGKMEREHAGAFKKVKKSWSRPREPSP